MDQEAYDEQKPNYKYESHNICNECGEDFHGWTEDEITVHDKKHVLNGDKHSGYHSEMVKVLIGYETIHHDEIGHNEQVLVKEAYDETISKGFKKCSECGKIENI